MHVVCWPNQPRFETDQVEVVEADVAELVVFVVDDKVRKNPWADSVGLGCLRREAADCGHVGAQIVPGEHEEVACVGFRILFQYSPTPAAHGRFGGSPAPLGG
jgi:hypothetical protein